MEQAAVNVGQLAARSKRFALRLLTIGENRLELLMVEVQEERERLVRSILLALGVAVFGLLGGLALTFAIAVLLWDFSPVVSLLGLSSLFSAIAVLFYRRLNLLQRCWKTLPATLDQFKKDRECLEKHLA
jgi:uncharacterized membrane protein YqjE